MCVASTRVSSTADQPVPEQWITFRISIGAGAILLLIAATLLVAAALSNAVAMPSHAGIEAITPATRAMVAIDSASCAGP
jgi:hypothetical protein